MKFSLDTLLKISQILVIPVLLAMFYLVTQINGIDKRLAVIEATAKSISKAEDLSSKVAVMEDRQSNLLHRMGILEGDCRKVIYERR